MEYIVKENFYYEPAYGKTDDRELATLFRMNEVYEFEPYVGKCAKEGEMCLITPILPEANNGWVWRKEYFDSHFRPVKPYTGYSFATKAIARKSENHGLVYSHFDIDPDHREMYGFKEGDRIAEIWCAVIATDLSVAEMYASDTYDENCTDYLCFFEYDNASMIVMPNIKLFDMCFAYGADAACFDREGRRRGTICRLYVEERIGRDGN